MQMDPPDALASDRLAPAIAVVPAERSQPVRIRPYLTLALLSVAHAFNHAQVALFPLVYLVIIPEFGISVGQVALMVAATSFAAGMIQISYAVLTRYVARRVILGVGNIVFGGAMAALALTTSYIPFLVASLVSRVGGSPQHPVGNALLAEQFPVNRRALAISVHIAGGNIGTVAIPLLGAAVIAAAGWHSAVVIFGLPAIGVGLAMLLLMREGGQDRAAALASGSARSLFLSQRHERNLLWLYLSGTIAGGGRGLGVVSTFVPLYLGRVIGLDTGTVAVMLTVLLAGSVPAPLVAGWMADRFGHKLWLVVTYLGGAAALAVFVLGGAWMPGLWIGTVLLAIFNFAESPQLQAMLADVTPARIRDVAYATYFTLAFGVGSLVWLPLYGFVIDSLGAATGFPVVFWLMAAAFLAAAFSVLPVRGHGPTAEPVEGQMGGLRA